MHSRFILILTLAAMLAACAGPAAPVLLPTITASPSLTESPVADQTTTVPGAVTEPQAGATTIPPTSTPGAQTGDMPAEVEARIRRVEQNLVPVMDIKGAGPQAMTLEGRMAYFNVPGVSIAVINEGQVEWAMGYGILSAGSSRPVTPETLFQAASISKPVTALGTLALVQEGKLDLDSSVNTWLKGWKAPEGSSGSITARQLLSHTAGLGVHGFPGYPQSATLPTVEEILTGSAPANSAPVTLIHEPGSQFDYSGGGYVALQQLLMDATGQDFPEILSERVFQPLGMTRSLYAPISAEMAGQAASGHTFDGTTLEGGWRNYPELGPAGLWSTPTDLAQVLLEIDRANRGEPPHVLDQELAGEMLSVVQENNGLGLVIPGNASAQMFGHGGSNAGYRTLMFAVRGKGQGAVVMTNSDNGMELIFEIFRAITEVYDWPEVPGWRPGERHRAGFVEVDPAVFARLAGTYQMDALTFSVSVEADELLIHIPEGGPGYRLYPDSETEYFTADGAQFVFELDESGKATSVKMNGWGEAVEVARRK